MSKLIEFVVISDSLAITLSHPLPHLMVYYGPGVQRLAWAEYCLECQNKHAYFND